MAKEFWFNLPVKDVRKSKAFFLEIGFTLNDMHGDNPDMTSFFIGDKNVVMMLFSEQMIRNFSRTEISDTSKGTEVLLSIDAQSPEEVDEMAKKAVAAGGTMYADPAENDGWMYGCGFCDLDGHRWNVLYMDRSKMPKR